MRLTARSWQITSFVFQVLNGLVGKGGGGSGGAGDRKWVRMLFLPFRGQNQWSGPFTVSQTLVDYQRLNWYLLGCFSLNKIPELCITRTILMIWLEPLEHIVKGVLMCFKLFDSSEYLTTLRSNISRCQKATTLILITLYNPLFHLWKSLKKSLGTTVFFSWIPFKICDCDKCLSTTPVTQFLL